MKSSRGKFHRRSPPYSSKQKPRTNKVVIELKQYKVDLTFNLPEEEDHVSSRLNSSSEGSARSSLNPTSIEIVEEKLPSQLPQEVIPVTPDTLFEQVYKTVEEQKSEVWFIKAFQEKGMPLFTKLLARFSAKYEKEVKPHVFEPSKLEVATDDSLSFHRCFFKKFREFAIFPKMQDFDPLSYSARTRPHKVPLVLYTDVSPLLAQAFSKFIKFSSPKFAGETRLTVEEIEVEKGNLRELIIKEANKTWFLNCYRRTVIESILVFYCSQFSDIYSTFNQTSLEENSLPFTQDLEYVLFIMNTLESLSRYLHNLRKSTFRGRPSDYSEENLLDIIEFCKFVDRGTKLTNLKSLVQLDLKIAQESSQPEANSEDVRPRNPEVDVDQESFKYDIFQLQTPEKTSSLETPQFLSSRASDGDRMSMAESPGRIRLFSSSPAVESQQDSGESREKSESSSKESEDGRENSESSETLEQIQKRWSHLSQADRNKIQKILCKSK